VATGNDSAACGAINSPCKSIKKAVEIKQDGLAVIKIASGLYIEEPITISASVFASDTEANNITFEGGWNAAFTSNSGYRGDTIIHTGNSLPNKETLFSAQTSGAEFQEQPLSLTFRCLTLEGSQTSAIRNGIYLGTENDGIADLTLENVRMTGFFNNDNMHYGLVLEFKNDSSEQLSVTIQKSLFDHNIANSVIWALGSNGQTDFSVAKSTFKQNGSAGMWHQDIRLQISGTAVFRTTFENTIIAENMSSLPSAISATTDETSQLDLKLTNCTLSGNTCGANGCGLNASGYDSSYLTVLLRNSILHGNNSTAAIKNIYMTEVDSATVSYSGEYNIYGDYGASGAPDYSSLHEISEDPILNSSYHLTKKSPAIDAGQCGINFEIGGIPAYLRIAPEDDIDGDKRPGSGVELGCDIGADEYKSFPWPLFIPAIHKF
jgi:hypothetical protein